VVLPARTLDRLPAARRSLAALAAILASTLAVLGAATPAGAVVLKDGSTVAGVQQPSVEAAWTLGDPATFANSAGAPVLQSTKVYAIYWDPTDHYHGDWQQLIDGFFQNVGLESGSTSSVFAVDTQYTDKANQHALLSTRFAGAYTDTDVYPAAGCKYEHPMEPKDAITCLSDAQIRHELEVFITDHSLERGMSTIFYLLTPPGVTVCLDSGGPSGYCSNPSPSIPNSLCSYHAYINPDNALSGDSNTTLYAVIPWIAGGLGDYHLGPKDQEQSGDACQDGGFNPASQPEAEEQEHAKEETAAEKEAFEKMDKEEQDKKLKERALQGPHQQEPNQIGLGPDGSYDTGLADLITNQIAIEQQNTATDPFLNGWTDLAGNEVTDECRNFFAGNAAGGASAGELTFAGTLSNQTYGGSVYYLNDAFNLASLHLPYPGIPCLNGIDLVPQFTTPNTANAGEVIGFDGMESDITLNWGTRFSAGEIPLPTYAVYKWNFGDGTPEVSGYAPGAPSSDSPESSPCEAPWEAPCAASTYHAYQYGGTYEVTLTVTDTGVHTTSVTKKLTIEGPPAPGTSGSGSGSSSPGAQQAGGGSGGSHERSFPGPVASLTALSKSLRKVLHRGLLVRYSVNEQVAGNFQIILSSRLAQRLRIHGPAATGLPAGSEPAVVVARAVLVTTKGGHSTIRIKLPMSTASRLRRVRKVSFMLLMTVRNASVHDPQTVTALSNVLLYA
jgi:hypothetical protein